MSRTRFGNLAWHVYTYRLYDFVTDVEETRAYVEKHDPSSGVATRLRLLKLVEGNPNDETWRAYIDARKACADAEDAWSNGGSAGAYVEAHRTYEAAVQALLGSGKLVAFHERECPNCTWNGLELRL